jgi:hypothetical protein
MTLEDSMENQSEPQSDESVTNVIRNERSP